jgi:hypothetical protein
LPSASSAPFRRIYLQVYERFRRANFRALIF